MTDQPRDFTAAAQQMKDALEQSTLDYIKRGLTENTIPSSGLIVITITDGRVMLEAKATIDEMGEASEREIAATVNLDISVRDVPAYAREADQ